MYDMYEAAPDLFVAGLATGSRGVAVFSFARYDPRDNHRLEIIRILANIYFDH